MGPSEIREAARLLETYSRMEKEIARLSDFRVSGVQMTRREGGPTWTVLSDILFWDEQFQEALDMALMRIALARRDEAAERLRQMGVDL